jgi:acetyl-CoA acetyltransferase family protein
METVVILEGARTPMAEYSGTPGYGKLASLSANELGALAAKEAMKRARVEAQEIDQVVIGNVLQTSADAIYGARHIALKAGIPVPVPALTVNRLCGSGIQSIITGSQWIQLGEASTCLVGGTENMSQAPHIIRGARQGLALGQGELEDSLMKALYDPFCQLFMAQTAEKLAKQHEISREEQDAYSLRSQQCAAQALREGLLQEEIFPVSISGKKSYHVEVDDHFRPDTSLEKLATLRPAFGKEGSVTAGNASGIVDGAAALVLSSQSYATQHRKKPLARICGWSIVGVEPSLMGFGPVPAIQQLLEKQKLSLEAIDRFEINEAFAAQYLAVEKSLALPREKTNVLGGAIALGHPLGATGTRLVLTLCYQLRRHRLNYGIAAACIGGGQGIAILVQNLTE